MKSLALGTAGSVLLPRSMRASLPDPLRLAFVGVGGWGARAVAAHVAHRYTAFCEVDLERGAQSLAAHPDVPVYADVRKMLDRHADDIDGVIITTPDHAHYPLAMTCLEAGKPVYLEKPMATTPWECRRIAAAARQVGVPTQLGVQGHSMSGLRVLKEWIDAGAVGEVTNVWFWTNRTAPYLAEWAEDLPLEDPVPSTMNWRQWLQDRPDRPFSRRYAPARWRNWWGLGSGAICDIGTHMFDVLKYVFGTTFPTRVEAEVFGHSALTIPRWAKVEWVFPATSARRGFDLHWRNGWRDGEQLFPEAIPHLAPEVIRSAQAGGMAFVGTEGTMFIPDMRAGRSPKIYPESRHREVLANRPEPTLERVKGGHFENWFEAIRTGGATQADFSYGAELTEQVLLGALAQRSGEVIRWDPATMTAVDAPRATAFARPERRADAWEPGSELAAVLPD